MNKVIIVTFQSAYNYGATLQCFSLQETIRKLNYDCQVLNYDNSKLKRYDALFRIIPKCKSDIKYNLINLLHLRKVLNRNKSHESFINKNLNLTNKMKAKEIKKLNLAGNTLIAGSDQVWNTFLTLGFDDIYFLNFGTNVKKISYAASIGTNDIDSNYICKIKNALNKFDYISVREETGKKALQKIINKNIDVVLDPTLLLTKENWEKYISEKDDYKEKYILVYMPNSIVIKIANYLAKKENLKVVNLSKENKYGKREINKYDANPFEFLNLVKNAKYIVTISFHATVFSILFNKKFWVVPDLKVSSRITDLLKMVKLEDRIIKNYEDFLQRSIEEIDYTIVNKVINEKRRESINKLKMSLKQKED